MLGAKCAGLNVGAKCGGWILRKSYVARSRLVATRTSKVDSNFWTFGQTNLGDTFEIFWSAIGKNISEVRENVIASSGTQATRSYRIFEKNWSLHAHKIQLAQELKPADHLKRHTFTNWLHEQTQINMDFSNKIIFNYEAHFNLSGFVIKQICRATS